MLKSWKERKIKERKRKSTQTRLPGFELALLSQLLASRAFETSPSSQGKKIQDTFDLWILCRDQSRDPLSLKKTLLMLFQMQIKVKKSDVNRANIFCRKKLKPRREHDLRKHIFFNGRLSVLLAARLIKASRIFVALQKSNRPWEIKESFLAFWLSS